jgi:D-alanine-D-alanine ligase
MIRKKAQTHIEIVRSTIPSLSSMGQKSCDSLYALLKKHYTTVGVSIVNTPQDLASLAAKQPDLVFMGMKYVLDPFSGSKIWISSYLEQAGIPHTGSRRDAIELEQEKPLAKQCVLNAGVKTSPYVVVKKGEPARVTHAELVFPLFVKPSGLGAGKGVDEASVVHTAAELQAKVASLANEFGSDALVETYLSGREFSVAVLKRLESDELMTMPLELVAGADEHGDRILSHKLKSAPLETPVFPVTDAALRDKLMALAADAFTAIGGRDYGRIDIRLDAAGVPHFLEANLIPCIIEGSGNFPKACVMNINMGYEAMIMHIVQLALARGPMPVQLEREIDGALYDAQVALSAA